jgi:uncharacterized RDD family membrane protein YckC
MSELDNPYAPPVADEDVLQPSRANEIMVAPQGARFVNFLIDTIAARIFGFSVVLLNGPDGLAGGLLALLVPLAYYVVCEAAFQTTLGKLVTGTRVVTTTGGKPTFGQVVGRTFARYVPFEPFSLLSKNPIGWHDSWTRTRVVKKESVTHG